jgi:hypothetical protein
MDACSIVARYRLQVDSCGLTGTEIGETMEVDYSTVSPGRKRLREMDKCQYTKGMKFKKKGLYYAKEYDKG